MKRCTNCGDEKSLDEFPRHGSSKDGRAWWCKPCHRSKSKTWRVQNPEQAKATMDRYRAKNPISHRSGSLSRNYGITEAQYQDLHDEQDGRCGICGNNEAGAPKSFLCVDHIAGTMDIRGLLCSTCNSAIGLLRHDTDLLMAAIAYLGRPVRMTGVKIPRGVHRARFERDRHESALQVADGNF